VRFVFTVHPEQNRSTGEQIVRPQSKESNDITKIHLIQTGNVKVKALQRHREGNGGIGKILLSRSWTEWLPINAWAIDHAEGLMIVDTGETARTSESGYSLVGSLTSGLQCA
jgi:hypothetical protein